MHAGWQEIVNAPDIDAICIGTWPYMHCEMTTAVLGAGKHVLCEARMAMNAAEGRRMLDASRKAPSLIAQLVPAPHTLELDATVQALLAEGFLGEVLAVELQSSSGRFVEPDAPLHWRHDAALSGHNILNMGIWYEAMMRWLGPAQRVTSMTKVAVPKRKDAAGATHEVKVPGSRGHPRPAPARRGRPPALQLGDRAGPRLRGVDLRERRDGEAGSRRAAADRGPAGGVGAAGDPGAAQDRIGWRVEEEFVNAIRGREKIARTTFEDGVRYMEFTDAVTRSATSGQTVEVRSLSLEGFPPYTPLPSGHRAG